MSRCYGIRYNNLTERTSNVIIISNTNLDLAKAVRIHLTQINQYIPFHMAGHQDILDDFEILNGNIPHMYEGMYIDYFTVSSKGKDSNIISVW